ncbi:3-hydroxy-3-methylglutaryl coenzyme A synthase [Dimargaris cristalligena]|uniref:Hydroxymethylglutaryl-CoA synthase n=1 Tax=Dimargaris cristalligena TaxID=215637 RepID=A0A4Q0A181_9FUNG|nr:3-hydroxy-3-methylglutaryl coenzyme A synthase [Dimargaris cristalligena]RKP39784.1 hydroxymethylglutaryl-coenzyme A synthase N terminal-domain-containing protein [Dimargaris cristalligena]|eukprot:RKP39784.1 hydroxymethylglutaryl-coenzyme A synthase N terminal-domain-containing protein [Dimargaris cristalligena]
MTVYTTNGSTRPSDVGIQGIEVYFPRRYVDQAELEQFDGVSTGKYTIGLGQSKMAFSDDREDIASFCLTAVQSFMEKYQIDYKDIGRLEVGTETIVDKSKSTKTVLMQLFRESGNYAVEGVDTTNACYGGTSALFNAIHWVESSHWDGRLALVVAADIAVYAKGNARPSGGAGAVVMLVGPNAPLVMEAGLRSTYMDHLYDFYKPDLSSEFPEVDGPLSVVSYVKSVDACYRGFLKNVERVDGIKQASLENAADYMIFHSPYTKQVVKGLARMGYVDYTLQPDAPQFETAQAFREVSEEQSYTLKDIEKTFVGLTKSIYTKKVNPSLLAARDIGNSYCASLYFGLASLVSEVPSEQLAGRRIAAFSYGSGSAASMFSFRVKGSTAQMAKNLSLRDRLDSRTKVAPDAFDHIMSLRESTHQLRDYKPVGALESLFPGTYYLENIDSKFRREYKRVESN